MKKLIFTLMFLGAAFALQSCSVVALFVPSVKVMVAEAEGKAQLAEAEGNRQIKVLEAKAALESAELLGKAEVVRATSTAQANKILGDSLKNNEAYLRYLWIQQINTEKEVYYIPTEAGLPILEAGRAHR